MLGVLITAALLFWVYINVPHFWKLLYGPYTYLIAAQSLPYTNFQPTLTKNVPVLMRTMSLPCAGSKPMLYKYQLEINLVPALYMDH